MIKVIDGICGSGKSTYIINKMKDNPTERYLYISPLLSEIESRIPNELDGMDFKNPTNRGDGKLCDLEDLVSRGHNIASTHKLFSMFTPAIIKKIIKRNYTLIIDEAIDCFGLLPDKFKPSDTEALLTGEFVTVDEENRGRLVWNEEKYPEHDGRYEKIRHMCNLEMMYCYKGVFLMWEYPPSLLRGLDNIYVLTYLFKGSDMRCWLQLNDIEYETLDNEELGLRGEDDIKDTIRENLCFVENRNLKKIRQRRTTLSKGWFDNANKEDIDKYKAIMRSSVVKLKKKRGDIFWTTFKSHASKLAGDGYRLGVKESDKGKDGVAFIPCTTRSTNNYKDYSFCMYAMNRFKNPVEVNYMKSNGVEVDEESFVLGEMIQFVFRGCIREGKKMDLLVLSNRMESLFKGWLYES